MIDIKIGNSVFKKFSGKTFVYLDSFFRKILIFFSYLKVLKIKIFLARLFFGLKNSIFVQINERLFKVIC